MSQGTNVHTATAGLQRLMAPRSIAIVGASRDLASVPGRPLRFLVDLGFKGEIYPVSQSADEIYGVRTISDIESLPMNVDLAIVTVKASSVLSVVDALGQRAVGAVVVFADGFSDGGVQGSKMEADLLSAVQKYSMRLLGPNSNGLRDVRSGLYATFSTSMEFGAQSGPIGLISQSGAMAALVDTLALEFGVGSSFVVDVGNQADIDSAAVLRYLTSDPCIRSIGLVVEGVRSGRSLADAIEYARASGKHVGVLSLARSKRGRQLAESHSGRLGSDAALLSQILRSRGATVVDSELLLAAYLAVSATVGAVKSLACVTLSGGVGIAVVDAAEAAGIKIPAQVLDREGSSCPNPSDLTARGMTEPGLVRSAIRRARDATNVDAVVLWMAQTLLSPSVGARLRQEVLAACSGDGLPVILTGFVDQAFRSQCHEAGVVVISSPTLAVEAMGLGRAGPRHEAENGSEIGRPEHYATGTPMRTSSDSRVLLMLAAEGLPVVETKSFRSGSEALSHLEARGSFPQIVKVAVEGRAHKSEDRLVEVVVNIDDAREACTRLDGRVQRLALEYQFLVQPLVRGVREIFLGYRRKSEFGPVVIFGMGGLPAELAADVAMRLAPATPDDIMQALTELRMHPMLGAFRGLQPVNIPILAKMISDFSQLMTRMEYVLEADVNPIIIDDGDLQAKIVDATVIIDASAEGARL